LPRIAAHIYTALVFMVGWVFFRADSLAKALAFLAGLGRLDVPPYLDAQLFAALNMQFFIALVVGIIFAFPVFPAILSRLRQLGSSKGPVVDALQTSLTALLSMGGMAFIIIYCSAQLIGGTHNPFLYFRF
jgi:alginate O-acetyltransferase complex protein AlgI